MILLEALKVFQSLDRDGAESMASMMCITFISLVHRSNHAGRFRMQNGHVPMGLNRTSTYSGSISNPKITYGSGAWFTDSIDYDVWSLDEGIGTSRATHRESCDVRFVRR